MTMVVVGLQEAILTAATRHTYNAGIPYLIGSRVAAGPTTSKKMLMSMTGSTASTRALARLLAIASLVVAVAGCQTSAGKGAAEGAGTGAIAGAVGGAITALVFGGDPVEAAARSAVWGASAGAATGAIAGSQVDKKTDQQKEAEFAKLRDEIGEENFAGLEALADCRYEQSLRAADKGRQSKNPNCALAGLWLEILSYADKGQEAQARALFPTLVKQDWKFDTTAQAESKMREGTTALGNIREEYDRPRVCAA